MPTGGIKLTMPEREQLGNFLRKKYHQWAADEMPKPNAKTDVQDWALRYMHMPHSTVSGLMNVHRNWGFDSARRVATALWKQGDIKDWLEFCELLGTLIM